MSTDPQPATSETPNPPRRWPINLFIGLFLAVQIALPLRFYLLGSSPDERFCWRMFSSLQRELETARYDLRVTEKVEVKGREVTRAVPLESVLAEPWVGLLKFAYAPVIDAFLPWRLQESAAREIHYWQQATRPDGRTSQPLRRSLKSNGR